MSLFTRVKDFFSPIQYSSLDEMNQAIQWRQVQPVYDVYAEPLVMGSKVLGITDLDAPTADEQRTAYRGLVSTLVSMRALEIATALTQTEVKRKIRPGELEDVEDDHPWRMLLEKPSPNYSAFEFWEDTSKLQDMGAGAFMLVGFGDFSVPIGLFTVYPEFGEVRPTGAPDGGIGGFVHYTQGGAIQPIDREQMIWLHHRHPVSPYEGASLLEQAAYNSDISLYQSVYARDMTKEGNVPPVYAKSGQMITVDQAKTYGETLTREYRTAGRRQKTLVLGHDMELKTLAINPNDLQYIEAAELNDRQIMRIFGFPPAMFEQAGVVANSKEVRRQWLQNSIQREVDKMCASLTHQFKIIFGAEDSDLCIVPPNVVPVDEIERERIRESQLRSGSRTPNEFRLEDGKDEYPEGNIFMIGGALRPMAEMVAQPEEEEEDEPDMENNDETDDDA